ncbi:MAG: hypothetical protein M1165_01490, partial [Candidatus Pacearchaeota archaeon]|nr:hypothetical protein [Candidatus Pacearchaeota archaeon]
MELLGLEHDVTLENVVISKDISRALFANIGIDFNIIENEECFLRDNFDVSKLKNTLNESKDVLAFVNSASEFEI